MSNVYIVGAKRTAIGSYLGSLKDMHPADLGAKLIKNIIEETKINPSDVDEIIVGNILPAGLGQGVGRQVAIKAGLPVTVPGYSLNIACGSGMKAIMNGYANISLGIHHLVFAGGVESMSHSPFLMTEKAKTGHKMGDMTLQDHMMKDALLDAFDGLHMGMTAENIAEKYNISRVEQDEFAYDSQKRAISAIDNKRFKDEILPIEIKTRKEVLVFGTDEYPNRATNLEILSKLRTVFKKDGTVTAGNSSGINDGASFVLLASEEAIEKYHLTPLAQVVGIGQGGVEPKLMGLGPTPAIRHALNFGKLQLKDIDLIELNEAFAAQSLGVIHELQEEHHVDKDWILNRTNVNGGAIALGHPVGASGNRIVVTLLYEMKKRNLNYGLASLCIGGGMGTAIIIKNI